MRLNLPGCQMSLESGPDHAHASHSAQPEKEGEKKTSGTCGPTSGDLLNSESLQSSLANKLRVRLEGIGSPEYVLTWKSWGMQLGPPISAQRASVRRIFGRDSTGGLSGYPTCKASDTSGRKHPPKRQGGKSLVTLSGYATCTVTDATGLGAITKSSISPIKKPGVLNPELCQWLMGFPEEWGKCAPTVTQLSRK